MARYGDLDSQYFDDAGDPLVSGKIYFYETGTTTPKTTYADVNYEIPNTNPVILTAAGRQPNIFFDGTAKAILTKSDNTQILVRDPVGDTDSSFGDAWIASKDYNANAVVQGSDGQFYVSLINNNVNNDPVTTSGSWTFLYSVEWNAGITYKLGSVVTYDTIVYQSLQNANVNQNPSTITAYWVPIQLVWSSTSTYALNANVVGTDGVLYTSIQAANTGNIPASSPLWWAGTSAAAAASAAAASVSQSAALVSQNAAAASQASATASQLAASNSAAAAAASAAASEAASDVSGWVSGQAYLAGDVVWSPISFLSYRAKVNTSGTTDPSMSTNWELLNASGITSVVTATTATTLTNTKTLLQITPASYGVTVTLPDATTCAVGGPVHCIDNRGAYPVRLCDSTGALKGFIFAGVVSYISLDNNSTAAGVWAISSNELVGASAQLVTANMTAITAVVDIGSSRELILGVGTSSNAYAVVYNKYTNTFGSPTLVRAATISTRSTAVLSAADQVLVVSCTSTTAFEAVTLTISGTTITVNTAATATLSANISAFADGCGLIAVGSSFVTSYTVSGPAAQIRALSISGTTVTIGSAAVLDGTAGGLIADGGSSKVIAVSTATTQIYTKPYTVSGATLSAGTGTNTDASPDTYTLNKLFALGSYWCVLAKNTSIQVRGGIVTLSGTTTTISWANLFTTGSFTDAIVVGSNKVLALNDGTSNNANILTNTAGTASAGTAITLSAATTRACLYVDGTTAYVANDTSSNNYSFSTVNCSGASPTATTLTTVSTSLSVSSLTSSASNSVLSRSQAAIFSTKFARALGPGAVFLASHKDGAASLASGLSTANFSTGGPLVRGKADSERWQYLNFDSAVITKLECAV